MEHAVSVKPQKGFGMEGFVAKWYASMTRKSMDDFTALARRVSDRLPAGSRVLEVAPGPGYFAIELAKLGMHRVTGLDISNSFIRIARRNAAKSGVEVDFEQGDAGNMPFKDDSFDFLFCRAAFKNFSRPIDALKEMHRVLKPGGRALIIDLRKDASRESIAASVHAMRLSKLNAMITRLTFRFMLLKRAYTKAEFEEMLSYTDFGSIRIKEDPIGMEVAMQRASA